MDKIIEELVRETRYEIVETLLKMKKLTKEEIARAAEITVKEVEELEKELNLQKMERGMWREGRILDILLSRKKRSSFFGFWWAGEGKGWRCVRKRIWDK